RRGDGCGADGHYRGPALYAATRRRAHPPDHGRGTRFPSRQRASSQCATGDATNGVVRITFRVTLRRPYCPQTPAQQLSQSLPPVQSELLRQWCGMHHLGPAPMAFATPQMACADAAHKMLAEPASQEFIHTCSFCTADEQAAKYEDKSERLH